MFDKRVKKILPDENQYPYEAFYQDNKHLLWAWLASLKSLTQKYEVSNCHIDIFLKSF
jgi:hypothetical protein